MLTMSSTLAYMTMLMPANPSSTSPAIDLPLDVLLEIMKRCEPRDVIAMRRVSRLFHDLTMCRELWMEMVSSWLKRDLVSPAIRSLERPIAQHTTAELENVVRHWEWQHSGNHNSLNTDALKLHATRLIPIPNVRINWPDKFYSKSAFLLPGGRWLIQFHEDASASYYDMLAHDHLSGAQLIEPPKDHISDPWMTTAFHPHILHGRPFLTLLTGTCAIVNDSTWKLNIYEIALTSPAQLTARRLISLYLRVDTPDAPMQMYTGDIDPEHFVVLLSSDQVDEAREGGMRAVIVEWTQVADESHDFPRRVLMIEEDMLAVMLLPHRRLLINAYNLAIVVDWGNCLLHSYIPEVQDTIDEFDQEWESCIQLQTMPSAVFRAETSRAWIIQGHSNSEDVSSDDAVIIRQVVIAEIQPNECRVFGLELEYTALSSAPVSRMEILPLGGFAGPDSYSSICMGYQKAAVRTLGAGSNVLLEFRWPPVGSNSTESATIRYRTIYSRDAQGNGLGTIAFFDEGTGRCVLVRNKRNRNIPQHSSIPRRIVNFAEIA